MEDVYTHNQTKSKGASRILDIIIYTYICGVEEGSKPDSGNLLNMFPGFI